MKKFACKDFFTLYFNGRLLFACSKEHSIDIACIRKMMKLINMKTRDYYRSVSLDALTPVSEPSYEPSYEIKEEVAQDYFVQKNRFKPEFNRKYAYRFGILPKRLNLSRNRQIFISRASDGV